MLIALSGCSNSTSSNESSISSDGRATQGSYSQPIRAVLSCKLLGSPTGIQACLFASQGGMNANLKVRDSRGVKQFTTSDFASQEEVMQIPLAPPFEIDAQASSEEGLVLKLEIVKGSEVVYADEATEFGAMHADDQFL